MKRGTLSKLPVPLLLREVYTGHATGMLQLSYRKDNHSLAWRAGQIVGLDSTKAELRVETLLVEQGRLQRVDVEQATRKAKTAKRPTSAVLLEEKLVEKDRLSEAIVAQAQAILAEVRGWQGGGAYLLEEHLPFETAGDASLSTGDVILTFTRSLEPAEVRQALGDLGRILLPSSDPLLRFKKLALGPSEGYLLSRVDGTTSALAVIELIPAAPDDVARQLLGLYCTGLVEYLPASDAPRSAVPSARPSATPQERPSPAPAPEAAPEHKAEPAPKAQPLTAEQEARRKEILDLHARLHRSTHFELLDVPRTATEAQVKSAYFVLARRYHPDTQREAYLKELSEQIEAIFVRLGEAYDVLREARSRASYEAMLGPRPAEGAKPAAASAPEPAPPPLSPEQETRIAQEALRKAQRHFDKEQFWDAIQLLEQHLGTSHGLRSRFRVLLAKSFLKNPHWLKRAEEQFNLAIEDEPRNIEAHYMLGVIYLGGGLKRRALGKFRKVLELKPDHQEALAQAEPLSLELEGDDTGAPGRAKKPTAEGP